ncbi:MAG TPA: pitrilysin family protein [Blastocatellia bacterium]
MKPALILIFIASLSIAAQAQKEAPLPKDLPPYGNQPAFKPPVVKAEKLDNGLTVWLVAQPGIPKVSFDLVVLGGLAYDPPDRAGLSELMSNTINDGTMGRTAKQIAEEIQSAGGDLSIGADRDYISVSTSVLSSKIDLTVDLLADVVENASFPDSEVDLAKRNLSSSLQQREAEPGFQADRALAHALFGSGPYSVVAPTQDSLAKMTAGDLRREYSRRFRPDQALLVAVGDFDAAKMSELVREKLGGWKSPAGPPETVDAKPAGAVPQGWTLIPRPDSVQTTLLLGGFGPRRDDPDYETVRVADAIYGGTFSSRLVQNIREDKGYTYSPRAGLSTLRQAGYLFTQADVRNAVTGASLNEIVYEMNRMATTSPTGEELTRAKRFILGVQAIILQLDGGVASELANLWVNGLGPDAIAASNQKINATTADEVNNVGRKYFPASHMTIVVVGEEKVIRDALAPFGLPLQPAN